MFKTNGKGTRAHTNTLLQSPRIVTRQNTWAHNMSKFRAQMCPPAHMYVLFFFAACACTLLRNILSTRTFFLVKRQGNAALVHITMQASGRERFDAPTEVRLCYNKTSLYLRYVARNDTITRNDYVRDIVIIYGHTHVCVRVSVCVWCVCVCVCVCVRASECVCVTERERERERESKMTLPNRHARVPLCVCL